LQVQLKGGVHTVHPQFERRHVAGAGGGFGFGKSRFHDGARVADLHERRAVTDLPSLDERPRTRRR
jgi:hypothetical protein